MMRENSQQINGQADLEILQLDPIPLSKIPSKTTRYVKESYARDLAKLANRLAKALLKSEMRRRELEDKIEGLQAMNVKIDAAIHEVNCILGMKMNEI